MRLGNMGVYTELFKGVGPYKVLYIETDDGVLRAAGKVRIEHNSVILSLEDSKLTKEQNSFISNLKDLEVKKEIKK